MKIILISTSEQKDQLTAQCKELPADLQWTTDAGSLGKIRDADCCIDLLFENTRERVAILKQLNAALIVFSSVEKQEGWLASDCVRINGWNTFLQRPVIEAAGPARLRMKTEEIFSLFSKRVEWTPDITGFISLRVIAS